MNSGACFGFKYNSNFCFIFISLVAYTWQAKRVAQLVSCFVGNHKVPGSTPLETKTFFLQLIYFIFLPNFINLFHLSKLLILRWFFAHLSFNMSILWLCKKNSKNILFLIIFHLIENKSFLWLFKKPFLGFFHSKALD